MSHQINLTTGNQNLAALKLKKSNSDWVNLQLKHLPAEDRAALSIMAGKVLGVELEEDQGIVSAQFENGNFKRLRPPVLMQKNGQLCTKLGKDIFTIDTNLVDVSVEAIKLDKYEDISLVLTLEYEEDNYIEWPLPFSTPKEVGETLDIKKVQGWAKKGQFDKIAELLYEAKEAGSGMGNTNLPMTQIQDLQENTEYRITNVRPVNASYGKSYIINIIDEADSQEKQMWAPYTLKSWFNLGANLTESARFSFTSYINRSNKTSYDVVVDGLSMPETEKSAQLSTLF